MSAAGPGADARDAVLAALGDWLRDAGPAAREEMRACLRRVITWPWPEDMHVAVMLCRSVHRHGGTIGGHR
ncbi:MAG TPA: hypothetical protein VFQ68_21975 [Streptosporangiaceae bacterium]|nr:hypothetical protein [Streptosporangiaceae bacterium]